VTYIIGARIARKPRPTLSRAGPSDSASPLTFASTSQVEIMEKDRPTRPGASRFDSGMTMFSESSQSLDQKAYEFTGSSSMTALGRVDEYGRFGDVATMDYDKAREDGIGSAV
jgi:hypothetical protein